MSSRSLNRVTLIGNLTRDPELRYTPQGTPVCTFGLATNRSWQPSAGGDRQEATEFHRIVAWNKLAELCNELLFKGRKVYLEGRIQTRNWTDSAGTEKTTTEIVIDNMIVLDNRHREGQGGGGDDYDQVEYVEDTSSADQGGSAESVEVADQADDGDKDEPKKASAKTEKKSSKDQDEKVNPDDIPF